MVNMRGTRLLLALVCTFGLMLVPARAFADGNILVDWSSLLPGLTDQYNPNSANDCVSGRVRCVDATIREMTRRFNPLASSCDHRALFSLLYLRVTQQYRQAINDPHFFDDNAFVNHEDAVFAKYYFTPMDAYNRGDMGNVPQAWQIALNAATNKQVTGEGDLLLGVNAHVQRDLPFVLAAIGLTKPDGTSRKPDHDKVNQILYNAYEPAITEGAQRFDPSINVSLPPPLTQIGYQGFFQAVVAWRETAWRNAERLVSAPNAAARAVVAQEIESYAASQAQLIKDLSPTLPTLPGQVSRDVYCAGHHG
jgi:hypothetical protein